MNFENVSEEKYSYPAIFERCFTSRSAAVL